MWRRRCSASTESRAPPVDDFPPSAVTEHVQGRAGHVIMRSKENKSKGRRVELILLLRNLREQPDLKYHFSPPRHLHESHDTEYCIRRAV
ncbi:hypothetical protein EYF80_041605 [Liparis tanakae]|uniref:Uncharacterized protein n=1 Tax=Liparis tanakae TaxID=230148 RepID=A0A4Z2G5N9_9TELE|nr:hypothetical protein EYF80_041605 [Liparis tanakae]